jgi:hypothetical protein
VIGEVGPTILGLLYNKDIIICKPGIRLVGAVLQAY